METEPSQMQKEKPPANNIVSKCANESIQTATVKFRKPSAERPARQNAAERTPETDTVPQYKSPFSRHGKRAQECSSGAILLLLLFLIRDNHHKDIAALKA